MDANLKIHRNPIDISYKNYKLLWKELDIIWELAVKNFGEKYNMDNWMDIIKDDQMILKLKYEEYVGLREDGGKSSNAMNAMRKLFYPGLSEVKLETEEAKNAMTKEFLCNPTSFFTFRIKLRAQNSEKKMLELIKRFDEMSKKRKRVSSEKKLSPLSLTELQVWDGFPIRFHWPNRNKDGVDSDMGNEQIVVDSGCLRDQVVNSTSLSSRRRLKQTAVKKKSGDTADARYLPMVYHEALLHGYDESNWQTIGENINLIRKLKVLFYIYEWRFLNIFSCALNHIRSLQNLPRIRLSTPELVLSRSLKITFWTPHIKPIFGSNVQAITGSTLQDLKRSIDFNQLYHNLFKDDWRRCIISASASLVELLKNEHTLVSSEEILLKEDSSRLLLQNLEREGQKLTPKKRTRTISTRLGKGKFRSIEDKKENKRKKKTRKKRPSPPLWYEKMLQSKKHKIQSSIIDLTLDETPSPIIHKKDLKTVVRQRATRKDTKPTVTRKKQKTNYKSMTRMKILDQEANNNSSEKEDPKDKDWKPNQRRKRKKTYKGRIRKKKRATRVLRLKKTKISMTTNKKDILAKRCLDLGVYSAIAVSTESSILPTKLIRKRRTGKRLIKKKIPQQQKNQGDAIVNKNLFKRAQKPKEVNHEGKIPDPRGEKIKATKEKLGCNNSARVSNEYTPLFPDLGECGNSDDSALGTGYSDQDTLADQPEDVQNKVLENFCKMFE